MSRADIIGALRSVGIRPTTKRVAVAAALAAARKPITAEEVRRRVDADLVTIYRALELFASAGYAREVRFKDAVIRYELLGEKHHHHIVCTDCGAIDELPQCDLGSLESSALRRSGRFAAIREHSLEFFGTCVSCAKR